MMGEMLVSFRYRIRASHWRAEERGDGAAPLPRHPLYGSGHPNKKELVLKDIYGWTVGSIQSKCFIGVCHWHPQVYAGHWYL